MNGAVELCGIPPIARAGWMGHGALSRGICGAILVRLIPAVIRFRETRTLRASGYSAQDEAEGCATQNDPGRIRLEADEKQRAHESDSPGPAIYQ